MAEPLNDHHGHKQDNQNHSNTAIFTPADFLIHNKTQATGANITQNRGIADIALQAEQGHREVRRKHLGKYRRNERPHARCAQSLHCFKGAHIHSLNYLKKLLANVCKRKYRNRAGACHGAQTKNVSSDQRADQCWQRADQAQKQAHDKKDDRIGDNITGGKNRKRHGQYRTNERA